jgi:hypothetical protein
MCKTLRFDRHKHVHYYDVFYDNDKARVVYSSRRDSGNISCDSGNIRRDSGNIWHDSAVSGTLFFIYIFLALVDPIPFYA